MASSAKILVLFKQYAPHFALLDTEVLFVTADDETAIARWKELSAFDFTIIADPSKQLYRDFSLIQPKVTFGKVYDVIYKHVFLYEEKWQLCQRYRRITPQLPEKILDDILALRKE